MVGKDDAGAPKKEESKEARIGSPQKPLIIEPDELKLDKAKPVMPEVKGAPGKKIERREKKPVKKKSQEGSKIATVVLLLSFILLALGAAFLVLLILDVPLPEWLIPVAGIVRKIPHS